MMMMIENAPIRSKYVGVRFVRTKSKEITRRPASELILGEG